MWELQAEWLPDYRRCHRHQNPVDRSRPTSATCEMAEEKNYNYITMMEGSEGWFFKNPERRK